MAFYEKFFFLYTGEKIQPLGKINVTVTYAGTKYSIPLCGALLGRNWLRHIKLDRDKLPGIESRVPCHGVLSKMCPVQDVQKLRIRTKLWRHFFLSMMNCLNLSWDVVKVSL